MWQEAEKFLLKDKYIGPLVKKWGHCTIKPRIHMDYFQSLVGGIIGQQLSGRVADVIEGRLRAKVKGRYGNSISSKYWIPNNKQYFLL